jgi:uncharacterized protein (TIGR02466 family)
MNALKLTTVAGAVFCVITYNLFPTAVSKFELGREFTEWETAFFSKQETYKNQGNTTSTDKYVLQHKKMQNVKAFVEASVDEYLQTIYAPTHKVNLRLTQSWLNYTKHGEFHHKHAHPNSFVSGVLYIKAAKNKDKIHFYKDGYQQIKLPTENFNAYNSDSWWFEVGAGDLLLFPSSLTHMVETVQGDDRVSLAFNTFLTGYVGDEEKLTALHLERSDGALC